MKAKIISISVLAMVALASVAQTQYDAVRFGTGELNGTARL